MGAFNFEIPDQLHEDFKVAAIRKHQDMKELLLNFIKGFVKKNAK